MKKSFVELAGTSHDMRGADRCNNDLTIDEMGRGSYRPALDYGCAVNLPELPGLMTQPH
jgi:hypothetical protein